MWSLRRICNDIGRGLQYGFTRAHPDGPNGEVRFKFNGGTSGNASLDPFRASQFNVSWEDYFAPGGLISAGYFYKAVDNFVTTVEHTHLGGRWRRRQHGQRVLSGQRRHGKDFRVRIGRAICVQYRLRLPGQLHAVGFRLHTDQFIRQSPADSRCIEGFHQRHRLLRACGLFGTPCLCLAQQRCEFLRRGILLLFQDINGASKVYTIYSAPYGQLDGQVGYDFNTHFGIVASAVNLTNAKQHTYLQWKDEPFTYDDTGRRFFFGVKGKL